MSDVDIDLLPAEGALKVTFPFGEKFDRTRLLVRSVKGSWWHPDRKFWTIPLTATREFRVQAARLGLEVGMTTRVMDSLALGKRRREELERAKADETPLDLPTATTLMPFQHAGVRYLEHALHNFHGALLADDMGLGKTVQALAIIVLHERVQNVLVVVPATLKETWAQEIDKHFPQLTYTVVGGSPSQRREQWAADTRLKIMSYDLLLRDAEPRVITWDLVICDEITKLKNYKTQRTMATKKLNRQYGLGLSGIPLENRLEELHSVMDWVMPGVLGPGWLFVRDHVVKDDSGNVRGYRDIDAVRRRIAPYYIRRRKKDVLSQLPDKVNTDLTVELSSDEWTWYDATRDQLREQIKHNDKLTVANILTLMLRLKQITGDVRLVGETADTYTKTSMVGDILDGAGNHKVVFFTQFAQFAQLLADEYEAPLFAGTGVTSEKVRTRVRQEFGAGQHRCLFSTDAGAYGVNEFVVADVVVHIDQPWNPAVLRQREDRLHRIGQKSSVQVVHLIAARTIDLHVRRILHRKMALIEAVLDDEIGDDMVPVTKRELLEMLDDN